MQNRILKYLFMLVLINIVIILVITLAGCREIKPETTTASVKEEQESSIDESSSDEGSDDNATVNSQAAEEQVGVEVSETDSEKTDKSSSSLTTESSQESAEVVPGGILDLIEAADGYYSTKDYGIAKNTYRKAEIAIDESDLSDEKKQELIDSFYPKYEQSKKIIETARTHFTNAKQLEYEQKYEEALQELESAINIYPKYKEAIEEYENLKAMMGLDQ
jgi:tetratricopeptide (TPR) repeat protein